MVDHNSIIEVVDKRFLENLLARVQSATGPSYSIEVEIAYAVGYWPVDRIEQTIRHDGGGFTVRFTDGPALLLPPASTANKDDAVQLIETTLPGWAWKCGTCCVSDDAWIAPDFNCPTHGPRLREEFGEVEAGSIWDTGVDIDRRPSGNVPLALMEALLTAMIAKLDR